VNKLGNRASLMNRAKTFILICCQITRNKKSSLVQAYKFCQIEFKSVGVQILKARVVLIDRPEPLLRKTSSELNNHSLLKIHPKKVENGDDIKEFS
jgi:hypothetical protein